MKTKNNTIEGVSKGQSLPDLEATKKFVEQDLHAAHFMIGIVLGTKHIREAVVEAMATQIFEYNRMSVEINKIPDAN